MDVAAFYNEFEESCCNPNQKWQIWRLSNNNIPLAVSERFIEYGIFHESQCTLQQLINSYPDSSNSLKRWEENPHNGRDLGVILRSPKSKASNSGLTHRLHI